VLPFSAGNKPAKNIIELFPHKSSSVNQEIEQTKEDSLDYISNWFLERGIFVENKYDQEDWGECDHQGSECFPICDKEMKHHHNTAEHDKEKADSG